MANVIAIANQKGGVGKTTTAIQLSAYMTESGKQVLLLDLDPQANASSGLGIDSRNCTASSYQLLIDETPAVQCMVASPLERLTVIPAHIDLSGAEIELAPKIAREYILKRMLAPVRDRFDYMILDCPPSFGLITLNALTAADSVIIPLQSEYYALEGLSHIQNTIELIKINTNPQLRINGILFTQYDSRTRLSQQVVDEVRAYFPQLVYNTMIPRNVRLSEAPSHGLPINLYDAKSKGALAYQALAQEVMQRDEK